VEDGIPGWLQHCHETCCEKGGCCGRRACMVRRWFHCGNIISGQVDLHITLVQVLTNIDQGICKHIQLYQTL